MARKLIKNVPIAAEMQVAIKTALSGMPAAAKIPGFTKMMYAIVKNVVRPATISVFTLEPVPFRSKKSPFGCTAFEFCAI